MRRPLRRAALAGVMSLACGGLQAQERVSFAGYGGEPQKIQAKAFFEPAAKELGITVLQDSHGGYAKIKAQVRQLKPDRRPTPSELPSNNAARARPHPSTPDQHDELTCASCASSQTRVTVARAVAHAYVPIWRGWRLSSANVLCARSVRGGQAQIGRYVSAVGVWCCLSSRVSGGIR